jgi:hypothetical protein
MILRKSRVRFAKKMPSRVDHCGRTLSRFPHGKMRRALMVQIRRRTNGCDSLGRQLKEAQCQANAFLNNNEAVERRQPRYRSDLFAATDHIVLSMFDGGQPKIPNCLKR